MKLLPCPFCGSTDVLVASEMVECTCGAIGPGNDCKSNDEAVERWNRRTPAAPPEAATWPAKEHCVILRSGRDCSIHGPAATPGTAPPAIYCEQFIEDIPGFGTDRDKHRCSKLHRSRRARTPRGDE